MPAVQSRRPADRLDPRGRTRSGRRPDARRGDEPRAPTPTPQSHCTTPSRAPACRWSSCTSPTCMRARSSATIPYISPAARGIIVGFGVKGYPLAIEALVRRWRRRQNERSSSVEPFHPARAGHRQPDRRQHAHPDALGRDRRADRDRGRAGRPWLHRHPRRTGGRPTDHALHRDLPCAAPARRGRGRRPSPLAETGAQPRAAMDRPGRHHDAVAGGDRCRANGT